MSTTTRGRRTWTDDQLRRAVAASTSWRAVARNLGLKGTSAGVVRTIKRHASRLALDASHFTGQRRWSDRELKDAVVRGVNWADVLAILGVIDNAESRVRVKSHAVRLGLNVEHLRPADRPGPLSEVQAPDQKNLRTAAPAIAMAWFGVRGYPVALPIEPQDYDLLVAMPKAVQRVQVKSTTCRTANGKWQVGVGRRPYSLDKTAGKAPYDPDSLDLFFIIDGDGKIYLIPIKALAGRVGVTLDSYAPYLVGDASSLLR